MIAEKVIHWKDKAHNLKLDSMTKCYLICGADGFFIGLGGRFIIRRIDEKFTGIASVVLQELTAVGVLALAGFTGNCLERGFSQQ